MQHPKRAFVIGICLALVLAWLGFLVRAPFACVESPDPAAHSLTSRIPVAFVPNLGQWDGPARYVAQIGAMTVFLEDGGWTFQIVERKGRPDRRRWGNGERQYSARGVAVRMTFVGAQATGLVAEDLLPGRHHYFLGNDSHRWRSDVPLYGEVRYLGLYPGIDVRTREQGAHFEYDIFLHTDANLEQVEMIVEGIGDLRLDGAALVLETPLGPVRMAAPVCYEQGPHGEQRSLECRYALHGLNRFGFTSAHRRSGWSLVVDPGLVWSTYLGGTSQGRGCGSRDRQRWKCHRGGLDRVRGLPHDVGGVRYDLRWRGHDA